METSKSPDVLSRSRETIRRELRVAFSTRAQPVWFRVIKWIVLIEISTLLWRSPYFWWWVLGGLAAGLTLHAFWRWKTKGWTQAWGRWNDLESGRG